MEVKIEILLRRIAELKARLGMNSSNSSFPPSSDKVTTQLNSYS